METIKFKNKEYEIKFTIFALSKLKNFDLEKLSLDASQNKVFDIIDPIIKLYNAILTSNGLNVKEEIVAKEIDEQLENGLNVIELLTSLINSLTNSPFFKSLQSEEISEKK